MKPLALLLAGLVMLAGTPVMRLHVPVWTVPVVVTTKATAAVYVYEKNDTAIPVGVTAGIDRLNREKKIVATMFEDDTVDGTNEVPDQYRVPLAAARAATMPALVVLSGSTVMKVVKSPKTEEEVMGAVP